MGKEANPKHKSKHKDKSSKKKSKPANIYEIVVEEQTSHGCHGHERQQLKLKLKIVNTKAKALKDGGLPVKAEEPKPQNLSLCAKKTGTRSKESKQANNKKAEIVDPVSCPATRNKRRLSGSSAAGDGELHVSFFHDFIPFRKGRRSRTVTNATAPPQKGRGYRSGSVSNGSTTPTKGSWSLSSGVPMACSRGKKTGNIHSRREKEKLTERELHYFEYEEIEIEQYEEDQDFNQIMQLSGDGEGCLHHFSDMRQYEQLVAEESSPAPAYVTSGEGEDIESLWPLDDDIEIDEDTRYMGESERILQTPYVGCWAGRKQGQAGGAMDPSGESQQPDCMPGAVPIDFGVDDGWLATDEFSDHGYRIHDAAAVDEAAGSYILPSVGDRTSPVHHAAYLIPELDERELQHLPLVDSPFAEIADVDASCALNGFTEGEPRAAELPNGVSNGGDDKGKHVKDLVNNKVDGGLKILFHAANSVERKMTIIPDSDGGVADGFHGSAELMVEQEDSKPCVERVKSKWKPSVKSLNTNGEDLDAQRTEPRTDNQDRDSDAGRCCMDQQPHHPEVDMAVVEEEAPEGGCHMIETVEVSTGGEADAAAEAMEIKNSLGREVEVSQVSDVKEVSMEIGNVEFENEDCVQVKGKQHVTALSGRKKLCMVFSGSSSQDKGGTSQVEEMEQSVLSCTMAGQREVMVEEVVLKPEAPSGRLVKLEHCEETTRAGVHKVLDAGARDVDVQRNVSSESAVGSAASEKRLGTGSPREGNTKIKLEPVVNDQYAAISNEKAEGRNLSGARASPSPESCVRHYGNLKQVEERRDAKQDLETVRHSPPSMNAERDVDVESGRSEQGVDGQGGSSSSHGFRERGGGHHGVANGGTVPTCSAVNSTPQKADTDTDNQQGTHGAGNKFVSSEVHAVGRSEWDSDGEENRERYWERSRNSERDRDWDYDVDGDRDWEHRGHSSRSRDRYGRPYDSGRSSYDRSESGGQRSDRRHHYSDRRSSYRDESYRSERGWERSRERCGRRRWRDHSVDDLFSMEHERGHSSSSRSWEAKRPKKRGKGPSQDCTIFVGDLDPSTIDYELNLAFESFGEIARARVIEAQCYGFVTFESRKFAEAAVSQGKSEEGVHVGSQRVRVAWAHGSLPDWKIGVGGFAWTAPLPASPGSRDRRFSEAKQFPMESGGVRLVLPPPAKAGPKASLMAAAAAAAATAVAVLSSGPEVPGLEQQKPLPQGRQIIAYDDLF